MAILRVSSAFFSELNKDLQPGTAFQNRINVDLDHDALLDAFDLATGQTVQSISSTGLVLTRSGGFSMTVSGSGFNPVGSLAELDAAIDNGIATGTLNSFVLRQNSTEFLRLTLSPTQAVLSSGDQSITLDGALINSFEDFSRLTALVELAAPEALYLRSAAERAEIFSGLAAFGLTGITAQNGTDTLFSFNVMPDTISVNLAGYTLSVNGDFPDSLGEVAASIFAAHVAFVENNIDTATTLLNGLDLNDVTFTSPSGQVLAFLEGSLNPSENVPILLDGLDVSDMKFVVSDLSYAGVWLTHNGEIDFEANIRGGIVIGTLSHDRLEGDDGDDIIYGYGGGDFLQGFWGDDLIFGGEGDDTIFAGRGDDAIGGGNGNDLIYGGAERDYEGNTTYDGIGSNEIYGGFGNDTVHGGVDADIVYGGGNGTNQLFGYGGDDTLYAGGGGDLIGGGVGNDLIIGGGGNDSLYGGTGDDRIGSGAGNDFISGGAGSNRLFGGGGTDTVHGGAGNDLILGEGSTGNTLLGFGGDDTIYAGTGNDLIGGGAGNDKLYGGAGANTIYLGAGNDLAGGGAGNDVLYGGAGSNTIYGGAGNDTVLGGADGDTIYGGGSGRNVLLGNDGDDVIYAGTGTDFLGGGSGNDTIYGSAGANTIYLGAGNDLVGGGQGDDAIFAGAGANTIYAGQGNDSIYAGTGRDVIYGNGGADTFVFGSAAQAGIGAGRDAIADFEVGIDKIDLSALNMTFIGAAGFTSTAGQLRYIPGYVVGDVDGDGNADFAIGLAGNPALTADDFIL